MTEVLYKNSIFLWLVIGVALFLRVIFFVAFLTDNPIMLSFDSGHYDGVAQAFAAGNGFSGPDGMAHLYRLPGYPLFLAFFYRLVGHQPVVALFFQILLASFMPLLVFFLSVTIFPKQSVAARIAAVMTALHPGFLIFSGLLMSETVFVFLFLLFLLFFYHIVNRKDNSFSMLFSAGLLLGCVSLIRPVGPYLIALVLIILAYYFWKNVFECIKSILGILLGWFIVVSVWLLRNYVLTGVLLMHTFTGPHLFNHGATRVLMQAKGGSYQSAKQLMSKELNKRIGADTASSNNNSLHVHIHSSRIQKEIASEIFCKYPVTTITLFLKNMLKTVLSLYSSELLLIDSGGKMPSYESRSFVSLFKRFLFPQVRSKRIIPFIYYELLYHLVLLISFVGFFFYVLLRHRSYFLKLLVMLLFMGLFIGLSSVCGFARLRLPIAPLTIIGGAIFLSHVMSAYARKMA